MTPVESDLRRMVSNAKSFNEKSSDIFSDAEKIRKMVSNHMQRLNPAYADKSYVPFATPIPEGNFQEVKKQDEIQDVDAEGETDPEVVEKPKRPITIIGPSPAGITANGRRASSTPAMQDAEDAGQSFDGNTFQQAQEKIMTELIKLENDEYVALLAMLIQPLMCSFSGQLISIDFLNLPPRQLQDYYRIIKHPVCLRSVQKLVRGIKGRDKPTGVSFFKSWKAFETELNYIWNNAREYNEDESEIVKLAGQVEVLENLREDAPTEHKMLMGVAGLLQTSACRSQTCCTRTSPTQGQTTYVCQNTGALPTEVEATLWRFKASSSDSKRHPWRCSG